MHTNRLGAFGPSERMGSAKDSSLGKAKAATALFKNILLFTI